MTSILGRVRFSVKEKLGKELPRVRNAGVRAHYLIVINLLNGRSARTTAAVLGVHNTTVYRVAKRVKRDGEWGLCFRTGTDSPVVQRLTTAKKVSGPFFESRGPAVDDPCFTHRGRRFDSFRDYSNAGWTGVGSSTVS
jgi:hypothetical protein